MFQHPWWHGGVKAHPWQPWYAPGSCCQADLWHCMWGQRRRFRCGLGPAPGLPTPVFIHPAQCWVIRKCNIAVTSSLKTSSLSNLTCQLHPSRRRSRHTKAEWPEGAGPVAGGAAAACASCLVTSVGCDSSESTTWLPLPTPAICLG